MNYRVLDDIIYGIQIVDSDGLVNYSQIDLSNPDPVLFAVDGKGKIALPISSGNYSLYLSMINLADTKSPGHILSEIIEIPDYLVLKVPNKIHDSSLLWIEEKISKNDFISKLHENNFLNISDDSKFYDWIKEPTKWWIEEKISDANLL